jgi:hypothetical protein
MVNFNAAGSFLFLIFILVLTSCKDKDASLLISDHDYFSVRSGDISEFMISKTTYSPSGAQKVSQFLMQSSIGDTFTFANEQHVNRIEYSSKSVEDADWRTDSVGAIWKTTDRAFSQEQGQTIVKMYFPLSENLTWNGNSYNDQAEKKFRCVDKGMPKQIGSKYFPNTVTIIRQQDSTLLSKNMYVEIYAAGIGLIATEKIFVRYCYTPECTGIIVSGYKELALLKEHRNL